MRLIDPLLLEMSPESQGCALLLAMPDDVFSAVTRSLSPGDVCNLGLCCRSLHGLVSSEKVWLSQCEALGIFPLPELAEWRRAVSSSKSLCRFLLSVAPLMGIWVHQNPELGNVVYVMPGFASVVGCRVIPQELGPLGMEEGPILWSPVFEILCERDGTASFCLHGREKGIDYLYPGSVKSIDRACNVMLLEIEPKQRTRFSQSKSFNKEASRKISRSSSHLSRRLEAAKTVPFSRLAFSDRRKLLEITANQIRLKVNAPLAAPLFARINGDGFRGDVALLHERRSALTRTLRVNESHLVDWESTALLAQFELSDTRRRLDRPNGAADGNGFRRKSLAKYFRDGVNQILRKGHIAPSGSSSGAGDGKHAQLHEFLRSGDAIGLSFRASAAKISSYRAWPNMHDSRFALYKLPLRSATAEQDLAGLWGGTFGWPPGKPTEDKPAKALFFLLLSYDESEGQKVLIATKILEGTHYVLHPNGSAMFMVNVDKPSEDPFPWGPDAESDPTNVRRAFVGEGIANGYGFRYPGSKPGSLFVFENGHLAFVWKESRAVLTLQRLSLRELLKKGERVPPLPPTDNFSYLTKSYSNIFAGLPNGSNSLSSQRQKH